MYNFTKFITWPENQLSTFNICILGDDPFGASLNPIEKRSVKGKPIRLSHIQSVNEAGICHIVYMDSSPKKQHLLPNILTISSLSKDRSETFPDDGCLIVFFQRNGKVKLHINLSSLKESGLDVSAKLLEVADVREGIK